MKRRFDIGVFTTKQGRDGRERLIFFDNFPRFDMKLKKAAAICPNPFWIAG